MNTGEIFIVIVFGGGLIVGLISILVDAWRKSRVAEQNAVLKKDMIERGFTADEIVRVLEAGSSPGDVKGDDISSALVEHSYSSDDIAKVTTSLERCAPSLKQAIRPAVVKMIENGYKGRDIVAFIDARFAAAGERHEAQYANAR